MKVNNAREKLSPEALVASTPYVNLCEASCSFLRGSGYYGAPQDSSTQGAGEASAMQIALVDRWEKLRAAGGPFSTPSHPDGNLP